MSAVFATRFIVGAALVLSPALGLAQEASSSTGATVTVDEGAALLERLAAVADGGVPLADAADEDAVAAWEADVRRHAERSGELRRRCHEEIRKSNRDSVVAKSAQCLRADLLLDVAHRRKQADMFADLAGVDPVAADAASIGAGAFASAANAVVDGIDAGVFTSVDMLKQAKRNLHDAYRAPMLAAFARTRASRGSSLARSLASAVLAAVGTEAHRPFLDAFVPCVENAREKFSAAADPATENGGASYAEAVTEFRRCLELTEDENRA